MRDLLDPTSAARSAPTSLSPCRGPRSRLESPAGAQARPSEVVRGLLSRVGAVGFGADVHAGQERERRRRVKPDAHFRRPAFHSDPLTPTPAAKNQSAAS
jgi:hypothetical protein